MKESSFAERLSTAMRERNIKASDLSRLTGISEGTISCYVNGRYEAKQNRVYIFSKVLRVNPAWLMGYDVSMEELADAKPAHEVHPDETTEEIEKRLGLPKGALSNAQKVEDVEAQNKADMDKAMDALSVEGQREAVKRVREMANTEEYKRTSFSDVWGYGKK